MSRLLAALGVVCLTLCCRAQQQTLDIYFVDVEGGQATLFVTPEHRSLLIDTGWPNHDSRDAKRIVAAAHTAGLTRIDTVIITHFHDDHVGGVPQLLKLMPVGTFVDHGDLFERCPSCVSGYQAYLDAVRASGAKRVQPRTGATLPLGEAEVRVVSADGSVLQSPLRGAGASNPFCERSEVRPVDMTENGHSIGVVVSFGRFRATDFGDLTWDRERTLMCPVNRIGEVSLLIVSHHGWYQSSSPAYVDAVRPEVAIMDNGANKGGSKVTVATIKSIPGLRAMWQLHRSEEAGPDNVPAERIANLTADPDDAGHYLKVSASRDGSFTVFNSRTAQSVAYPAR